MPVSQTWGPKVSTGSQSSLRLEHDGFEVSGDGASARLINPRIVFSMRSGWRDSNNWVDSGGSAISGGRLWTGGTIDGPRTWHVAPRWVALEYGQQASATFSATVYGISFFNGDGSTDTYTWSIAFPKRAYSRPKPPRDFTARRVDDRRFELAWKGDFTGDAGATPWRTLRLDRWDNVTGGWYQIAKLPWSSLGYADVSTVPNRRYSYALWSINEAGGSEHVHVFDLYTTPAAPSAPTWTKTAGGDVALAWAINAPQATRQWVEDSTDGGKTWVKVSPDLAGTARAWTHDDPSTASPHLYRVVAQVPGGLSAASVASLPVQLLAAPGKPTDLQPASVAVALGEQIRLTWRHAALDGTPQREYQVRHRTSDAADWVDSGPIASQTSTHDLPAGESGTVPQWQVRTRGAHADWSPWADVVTYVLAARPVAGIATPDDTGAWGSSVMPILGTYHDPEGAPLAVWRIRLLRAGSVVGSWSGSTLPIEATAVGLADQVTYEVEVEARNTVGLWSPTERRSTHISYEPPAMPVVDVRWVRDQAVAIVTVTNPESGPSVVKNEVLVDGAVIASTSTNGSITWRLPPLSGGAVVVRATSDLPSSIDTPPITIPVPRGDLGVHINAGPGYSLHAAVWGGSPAIGWDPDVEKELTTWAGDDLPSVTYGAGQTFELSLGASVRFSDADSSRAAWLRVIRSRTTVCYRDPARTLYGVIDAPGFSESVTMRVADMRLRFVQTEHDPMGEDEQHLSIVEDPPGSGEYRLTLPARDVSIRDLLR